MTVKRGRSLDKTATSRPLKRRTLLAAVGSTGALGPLSGCLGEVNREYQAKSVELSEDTARSLGYESNPTRSNDTISIKRKLGPLSTNVTLTTKTRRWDYNDRESGVLEKDTSDPSQHEKEAASDNDRTIPETTAPGTVVNSSDNGGFNETDREERETQQSEMPGDKNEPTPESNETTTGSDSSEGNEGRKTDIDLSEEDGATATPERNGRGTEDSQQAVDGTDTASDSLIVTAIPNPNLLGVSLNPAASSKMENLIRNNPTAFEKACDCKIGDTSDVTIKTAGPGDTIGPQDVDDTVFALDVSDTGYDLPLIAKLFGEEESLRYFSFATSTEEGNIRTFAVLVARGTRTKASATNDIVFVSYVGRGRLDNLQESKQIVGENGLYSIEELNRFAERFLPVCPCLFDASNTPTTESKSPTDDFDGEMVPLANFRSQDYQKALATFKKHSKRHVDVYGKWLFAKINENPEDVDRLRTELDDSYDKMLDAKKDLVSIQKSENQGGPSDKQYEPNVTEESMRLDADEIEYFSGHKSNNRPSQERINKANKMAKKINELVTPQGTNNPPVGNDPGNNFLMKTLTEKRGRSIPLPDNPGNCKCSVPDVDLRLCVDCPDPSTNSFGHAFIRMEYEIRCVCNGEEYRFNVNNNVGNYPNGLSGDYVSDCDKSIISEDSEFTLTEAFKFQKLVRKQASKPEDYQYLGGNCMDWAMNMWYKFVSKSEYNKIDDWGNEPDTPADFCGPSCSGPKNPLDAHPIEEYDASVGRNT